MILCPWQVCDTTISGLLLNPTYNFTSDRLFVPFFSKLSIYKSFLSFFTATPIGRFEVDVMYWNNIWFIPFPYSDFRMLKAKFQNTNFPTSHCLILSGFGH